MRTRATLLAVAMCLLWAVGAAAQTPDRPTLPQREDVPPQLPQAGNDLPRGQLPCGLLGGRTDGYRYPRSTGTLRAAMLFVDFPDAAAPADVTPQSLYDGFVGPSHASFQAMSYGRFDADVRYTPKWVRMPKPQSAYLFDRAGDRPYERIDQYTADAVRAADPSIDFAGISTVYIVAAPKVDSPYAFFGEMGPYRADGQRFETVVTMASTTDYDRNYAGFVHETGHVIGLPDLYDTDYKSDFLGTWDIMAASNGPDTPMTAWSRYLAKWLGKRDFRCLARSANKTLTPVSRRDGLKAALVRTGRTRAWVVEARDDGNPDGCRPKGVLVYRVLTDVESGAGPVRAAPTGDRSDEDCGWYRNATLEPGEEFRAPGGRFRVRVLRAEPGGAYRVAVRVASR